MSQSYPKIYLISSSDDDLDGPRSPSSPPPPPLNYSSAQFDSAFQYDEPSTPKPPSKQSTDNSTAIVEEERARKRAERVTIKAQKEAALQSKRQQRIRDAFIGHESSILGRHDTVQIVVSESLFSDTSGKDILKDLRIQFPNQIVPVRRKMANLISWKRLKSTSELKDQYDDVPMCVFIFSAEQYLAHIDQNTLDECAHAVKLACMSMHRIVFVVCAIDHECRRRARVDVREGTDTFIVDKRAVQDSYVHLYMDYDIRTHDVRDLDELAKYLCNVTVAIIAAPFRQDHDLVSASLSFRRIRARATYGTAVVAASGPSPCNFEEEDGQIRDSDNEDPFGYDLKKKASSVRVEGHNDLGNIFLTMLCLIPGVTLQRAQCIRERYPTLRMLFDAYDECTSEQQRGLLLSELRYGENNRRLGPVLSKSIAAVLNSLDSEMPV